MLGGGSLTMEGGRRFLNEKRQVAWLGGEQKREHSEKQKKQNSVAAPVNTRTLRSKSKGTIKKKKIHACSDCKLVA